LLGGLRAATHPAVPYGPGATDIKKSLVGLPVNLGPHVPNARAHVSKTPNVRVIISLQDVRAGSAVNACKTCGQVAIVWLQCSAGPVNHSPSTAIVPSDPAA
jgi:hypothetical protein